MARIANQRGALVTGSSQRLGKAMAIALGRRGMHVAIHYCQSREMALVTVKELETLGSKAVAVRADLLDEAATAKLVAEARNKLGCRLHLLINNAAIFEKDDLGSATQESWHRHIGANLRAPFVLTQEFAKQAPGHEIDENDEMMPMASIINIVDECVRHPTEDFATYTISKMGLWSLTQVSAVTLAPQIRVNAIGPGPTLLAKRQSLAHFKQQRKNMPLARGPAPKEVISAMNFLLDNPSVTGQLICLDGGKNLLSKVVKHKQF